MADEVESRPVHESIVTFIVEATNSPSPEVHLDLVVNHVRGTKLPKNHDEIALALTDYMDKCGKPHGYGCALSHVISEREEATKEDPSVWTDAQKRSAENAGKDSGASKQVIHAADARSTTGPYGTHY